MKPSPPPPVAPKPIPPEVAVKPACPTRPGPPIGPLKVTDVNTNSVTLSWMMSAHNGGFPLISFCVEKFESGQWTKARQTGPEVTTICLTHLTEGRDYMFRVTAVNKIGASEPLVSNSQVTTIGKSK